jgi:hypothetical protein
MYVGRRPRRRGLGFISVVLSGFLIVVVGAVGFGVYSALTMVGVVPAASIFPAPPPTATATPQPTPIPMLRGLVVDAYTGGPLVGATITLAEQQLSTGADGAFRLPRPETNTELRIAAPDYEVVTRPVGPGHAEALQLALRPTRLHGVVRGGDSQPLVGARVTTGSQTVTTGPDGRYELRDLLADAVLTVEAPNHARFREPVGKRVMLDVGLKTNTLAGVVKDKEGKPIARATVALGAVQTTTGPDGRFKMADVIDGGTLAVKAGGFLAERRPVQPGATIEVALTPFTAKAIYLTHLTLADDKRFGDLLALVKRTELNAMVVDVKGDSGEVFYDSTVPLAREIGAVAPAYDIRKRLKQLREANVYAIARVVVMEDTVLATAKPEWAVRNKATGQPWRDFNNIAWMNAYRPEVWDYNVAIAKEVAQLGFDEVQYDYVRFPSDGPLAQADYGQPNSEEGRTAAIAAFLGRAQKELAPLGVYLAADLFGLTMVAEDDMGIGQKIESVADTLDYICPMVYPSHFARGSFGFPNPAAKPYDVIFQSMAGGKVKLGDSRALFRPWLQDFDLYGTDYTPEMVRAQIKAAEENQSSGWLIWNAGNKYQEAALRPGS